MSLEKLAEELIRYETVAGEKEEIQKCLDRIQGEFSPNIFETEEFENEGVKSLLISTRETSNIEILLHGHIDVVNAEEQLFKPYKQHGKIFGRGAADMKSGVACLIEVLKEREFEGVGLLITSDEEKGGFNGTGYVVNQKRLNPDLVISAEPDDSGKFPSIVSKQKGVLQLKISTNGVSAHASKPEKGDNAAEKLIQLYSEEVKPLFNSREEFSTSINLGKIRAGDTVNKVPDYAEMRLDIRYSKQYPKNEVLRDLNEIKGLEIEITAEAPMMQNDLDNGRIQGLQNSIEEISGRKCVLRGEAFASDMRFFTEKDVSAVCFGPEGYNLHGKGECVEIESLDVYCEILKNFLESELDKSVKNNA